MSKSKGFEWISYNTSLDSAYITVDNQQRLYLSSAARKLLKVESPFRLFVGHDHANKRLIAAKPEIVKTTNTKPFQFDKRSYCSAKPFIRALGIDKTRLPLRFEFAGMDYTEYPAGSFAFQLKEFKGADDK